MTWLMRIPRTIRLAFVVGVALSALVGAAKWKLAQAEQRGRQAERAAAAVVMADYVTLMTRRLQRKDSIVRVVDTLRIRVAASSHVAKAAIAAVPDAVRDAEPTVDAALMACDTLVADVARLTAVHITERAAWRDVHEADTSMIGAQAVVIVAQSDTIATLKKRPRWRTVVKVGASMGAVGVAVGKYLLAPKAAR